MDLVSVIITTKNEEKNIENCLKSIQQQTYPQDKIEIIVVDNYSTDKTKEIAQAFKQSTLKIDKLYNFQFFDKGPERSTQRNFGVEKSKGEYFLYLDADMILSPDVIKECVDVVSNVSGQMLRPELVEGSSVLPVALYVPEIIMGESFWCKVRRFERSFYNGTVIDCVRFVKREFFVKVGGFDESMIGPEDWDFDKKVRQIGKTAIINSPIFHNEAQFNLKKYLAKKGYYAQSFDTYIKKWGKKDTDIKKQFGLWYRYFGVFLEDGKWKRILMNPILFSGVLFLKFLVGLKFLMKKNNKINLQASDVYNN